MAVMRLVVLALTAFLSGRAIQLDFPVQATSGRKAPMRLAVLKTGRCASSVLLHEIINAACAEDKKCRNNFASEVLYPYEYIHKSKDDLLQAVDEQLLAVSSCSGNTACGWSICLSCLLDDDLPTLPQSEYWKAVEDVIIQYDMQVLLMTRKNSLEWAVSQALAANRNKLMKQSREFIAIPMRNTSHYMPCSSYTLDGCSKEQRLWVEKQMVTIKISELEKLVEHHHQVHKMFEEVQRALLERDMGHRIMWLTMEDMQRNESWQTLYNFVGLQGSIPDMHEVHGRYTGTISNYAEIQDFASRLGVTFD
eukprot:TRINITY_DN31088_c0_g1_i1.p1 TRINITY_DN31088_c0_g1~~TRINITY_DN31088_c0_g1_i1.p1  ORF type:complete len:308 (+),score=57.24 TRINITY_DN31088_c0_g1_i1:177-1100(+)